MIKFIFKILLLLMIINEITFTKEYVEVDVFKDKIHELDRTIVENNNKIDYNIKLNEQNTQNINNRISDLNENINYLITFFSILITLIIIVSTILNFISVKEKLEVALAEIKLIKNEAREKLKDILDSHENINQKKEKIEKVYEKLTEDIDITINEKEFLYKQSLKLDEIATSKYTFKEWWTKFLASYLASKYDNALFYLDGALSLDSLSLKEKGKILLSMGVLYGQKNNLKKEIKFYDQVLTLLKNEKDIDLKNIYGSALIKKSLVLSLVGDTSSAININDKVIELYENEINEILKLKAVKSTVNNLELTLIQNGRVGKKYEELLKTKFQEYKNEIPILEMLKILELLASDFKKSEKAFTHWIKVYQYENIEWRFDELEKWANTQEISYRNKLISYLNEFKSYFNTFKHKFV